MRIRTLSFVPILVLGCAEAHPAMDDGSMARLGPISFEMGTSGDEIPELMSQYGVSRAELFAAELPLHTVRLDAYELDHHEVTNAQFHAFTDAVPGWRPDRVSGRMHNGRYLEHWIDGDVPAVQERLPVTFITWQAAASYCEWAGKRLPSEAEWEYAARGGHAGDAFPWGADLPDPSRANWSASGHGRPVAVGSYAPNPFGLYDMAGNVWEFVEDGWRDRYDQPGSAPGAGESRRVVRGGSWGGAVVNLRVRFRDSHPANGAGDHVGFRCARTVHP